MSFFLKDPKAIGKPLMIFTTQDMGVRQNIDGLKYTTNIWGIVMSKQDKGKVFSFSYSDMLEPYSVDIELDWIKEDMGYETQKEFDEDYKTLCPCTMTDLVVLNRGIDDELDKVEKWCKEKNTPLTISHIKESLRFGPLGFFEEALEQRRDAFNDVLDPRKIIDAARKTK